MQLNPQCHLRRQPARRQTAGQNVRGRAAGCSGWRSAVAGWLARLLACPAASAPQFYGRGGRGSLSDPVRLVAAGVELVGERGHAEWDAAAGARGRVVLLGSQAPRAVKPLPRRPLYIFYSESLRKYTVVLE